MMDTDRRSELLTTDSDTITILALPPRADELPLLTHRDLQVVLSNCPLSPVFMWKLNELKERLSEVQLRTLADGVAV